MMGKKFWNFKAATGNKNPQLLVYGDIFEWWGEVQSRDFAEQLAAIDAPEIDVRINSNGGEVFTAQAIHSSLKRHPAKINVYIDGIAASSATIIAMAGDHIVMPENAMMMIHSPLVGVYGNADELRDMADVLDKVRDTIVAVYREQSGLDDEKILELMSDDTYLTASESLELGLIDEITPSMKIAASRSKNGSVIVNGLTMEAERFNKLPEQWQNAIKSQHEPSGASGKTKVQESVKMTLDELKADHPELFQAAVEQGHEQERARIQAIDEMVMPGHEEIANKAKFETGISPEAFAVEVIKAEKAVKDSYLANRQTDAEPVAGVKSSDDNSADGKDEKRAEAVSVMARAISARNNRKV